MEAVPEQQQAEQQQEADPAEEQQAAQQEQPAAAPAAPPNPLAEKVDAAWKQLQGSPNDFNSWTNLITAAEKLVRPPAVIWSICATLGFADPQHQPQLLSPQDDIQRLREVYEPFLAAYPLCYGYWKKYADAEMRHQSLEGAMQAYERGVAATPYSMDLWGHYATFKKANGGSPDEVRK